MTKDKLKETLGVYRNYFEEQQTGKKKIPADKNPQSNIEALEYMHAMLDEMEEFLKEGRIEKFHRWLGFLQGNLWRMGIFTLEELKNHNRPL